MIEVHIVRWFLSTFTLIQFNSVKVKLTFGCIFNQQSIAEQNQKIVRKAKDAQKGSFESIKIKTRFRM